MSSLIETNVVSDRASAVALRDEIEQCCLANKNCYGTIKTTFGAVFQLKRHQQDGQNRLKILNKKRQLSAVLATGVSKRVSVSFIIIVIIIALIHKLNTS